MSKRQKSYLRGRYRAVFGYTGFILLCIGLIIMAPLLLAPIYGADGRLAAAFLIPGGTLAILGGFVWRAWVPREPFAMTPQEGAVAVVLSWLMALIVGAIPFVFTDGLSFNQALFEATSGWTTTGLSVIDVTATHPLVLFYRSLIQFAGGAGFAIIMLALISGPAGTGLSSAEGRGDQLVPHVRQSAAIVLQLYVAYAVLGTVALWLVGMSLFDAVNHAFAALSTGGFSTRPESIGYWDSFAVEAVISILMILGTTNFLTAYAVVNGRWRALVRSSEMQTLMVLLI
ncbi:MAG: TrkH family potassium uptake protein, partial [Anaerolineales bacterium]|nr:TrkH family potassium uptake protein [Anaerolineales bacterium]